jgi:FtsH-binding integral membrane protein
MEPLSNRENEEENVGSKLSRQAASVLLHTGLALLAWAALMAAGYASNSPQVPQGLILLFSVAVPFVAGFFINRFRQDELAPTVWLIGLIWFLIIALWVLDMPTGPNACFQCDATDKITRTFFSLPSPSGLIDNDGPFFATWPAAALIGYSIGAGFALKRRRD